MSCQRKSPEARPPGFFAGAGRQRESLAAHLSMKRCSSMTKRSWVPLPMGPVSSKASTRKLNIGTDYGVSVGDCVITEAGYLVGLITDAGSSWCTCTTVIDTETSIGARVFRTGEVAVAQGDFSLMADGRLSLSYLSSDTALLVGDLVVTSGLGGYYPSDLVIGYVQEIKTDDDGLAQYAVLQPAAQIDELRQVFVVVDFTIVD